MLHYLDNAATTPVRPEAAQAALEAMTQGWGNPSSQYALGKQAAGRMKGWREDLAKALGCRPEEVFFTSCGSESDNWAISGALECNRRAGKHIITTAIEHAAVLEPLKALERQGYEVTYLQPDRRGSIDPTQAAAALRPDTALVSMMLVNNELGAGLPVKEVAQAIKRAGCSALLHCDAVQGFLKVPFTPRELGVDLLSVSGHKIHAPKGVGALYVRKGVRLPPLIRGGGQEGGYRSGTEATSQIAAFAAAARLGAVSFQKDAARMAELKAYTLDRLAREMLRLTSTFGVRRTDCARYAMEISVDQVDTDCGPVRRKTGTGYGITKSKPEYADLDEAARRSGVPLAEALRAFFRAR